jgi:pyruvyltransferase
VKHNVKLSQRPDVLLINLREPVHKVLADIDACEAITSSSLHGLVAGDALRKPTIQFNVSTSCRIIGGLFKYNDYYSAFDERLPEPLTLVPRTTLEDVLSRCILRKDEVSHVQTRLDQVTRSMCTSFV